MVDEVQTGMGATGTMWAIEHMGVRPDVIAFGKKARVCGIIAGERVDEVPDNVFKVSSRINSTWGGNLVDMVRSQRYLEIIAEENLVENAGAMGRLLLDGLNALAQESDLVSNVRGQGMLLAFDLPDTRTGHLPGSAAGERPGCAQVRRTLDSLPPDARPGQRHRGRSAGHRREIAVRRARMEEDSRSGANRTLMYQPAVGPDDHDER